MDVITTDRLVLRHFKQNDAEFILELLNEPGWKRFIGDRGVNSIETARNYIETVPIASYAKNGFGLYAVELRSDGNLIGMCGLLKRDTLEHVDIGFAMLSPYGGNGYASEAAAATLEYARNELGICRVLAITTEDNEMSGRVLQRAGMKFEEVITVNGDSLRLYAIDFSSGETAET